MHCARYSLIQFRIGENMAYRYFNRVHSVVWSSLKIQLLLVLRVIKDYVQHMQMSFPQLSIKDTLKTIQG